MDLFTIIKNAFKVSLILAIVSLGILIIGLGVYDIGEIKMQIFWAFYFGIPLSTVNEIYFTWLNDKLPWETQAKSRAWVGAAGSIFITMLTLFILYNFYWYIIRGVQVDLWSPRHRHFYLIGLLITIFISSFMHALGFFKWAQRELLLNEKLRKEKAETELNVLKNHIDPHFLFNSFNILSGLIDEDPKRAQHVLDELSGFYRHILEQRNENTDSVVSELDIAQRYLNIQAARFESSIFLETHISETEFKKHIPTLSLQMLMENAIKHNAFDADNPLIIKISAKNDMLYISNNKRPRKNLTTGNGIGLENIKDRYALLSNQKIIIQDEEDTFTVTLPLLTNPGI